MTVEATPTRALEAAILVEIDKIVDPCSACSVAPMGLVEMGLVAKVEISPEGEVDVRLRLTSPTCQMVMYMAKEIISFVSRLPGVAEVRVHADAGIDWDPDMIAPAAAQRRRERLQMLRAGDASQPSC
ncbi:MAG: hypothetical protein NVS3B24_01990 [Candidatus Dormibacteria bacterium]